MEQVREIVRSAYEDDMRELTYKEESMLDYLSEEKYGEAFDSGTDEDEELESTYASHRMLVLSYKLFSIDATEYSQDFLSILESLEKGEEPLFE